MNLETKYEEFNEIIDFNEITDFEEIAVDENEQDTAETNQEPQEDYEDMEEKPKRQLMYYAPGYMETVSMDELYEMSFEKEEPLIEDLLYKGIYLFVGGPKLGKSFMMLQIAHHVCKGESLWGHKTNKAAVLYLALEDNYNRLQQRLYRMFGTEVSPDLHFSVKAGTLNENLDKQLNMFLFNYPETKLVIIDTLQKVREVDGINYSYANDYEIMTRLKEIADFHKICLLIVHHTRKQAAEDSFDMISGTNGLLGAVDGAFILSKDKRTSNKAVLEISGRDQQEQKIHLIKNLETLAWEFEEAETEIWKTPPEPILQHIAEMLSKEENTWVGTATELVKLLELQMKPNSLTLKLNVLASRLKKEYGIIYENKRSSESRRIILTRLNDDNDDE